MASPSLFSPDQMAALEAMISGSVNAAMKAAVGSIQLIIDEAINSMQSQENSQLPPARNVQTSWKSSEIGFFYPDMPISWGCEDVVDREDKIYYRSATTFTNRLRIAASTRDAAKIRQNLDTCLHGEAKKWWTNELDELVRVGLIAHHNDVKQ